MPKLTFQNILIGLAVAMVTIYVALKIMTNSPFEQPTNNQDAATTSGIASDSTHPIIGKSKSEIAKLFPGNCFAELYLKNPSFGGKIIESCKQKTVEQIKAVTGESISKSELTSTEVIRHLKVTYGANNPWRL